MCALSHKNFFFNAHKIGKLNFVTIAHTNFHIFEEQSFFKMMKDDQMLDDDQSIDIRNWDWTGTPTETATRSFSGIRRNRLLFGGIGLFVIVLIVIISTAASPAGNNKSSSPPEFATIPEEQQELFTLVQELMKSENLPTVDMLRTNAHQYKAFTWLTENVNLDDYDDSQKIQRFILACFYYATYQVTNVYVANPEPWSVDESWMTDTDECEWAGIHCDSDKHVHSISLEKNKLSGRLPMELALLKHSLKGLDLTANQLCMKGDDLELFGHFVKLAKLEFDENYLLTGDGLPSSLALCTALQKLTLSSNLMEGPFDNGVLDKLTKLSESLLYLLFVLDYSVQVQITFYHLTHTIYFYILLYVFLQLISRLNPTF
jgi:hypothetical protein